MRTSGAVGTVTEVGYQSVEHIPVDQSICCVVRGSLSRLGEGMSDRFEGGDVVVFVEGVMDSDC